MPSVAVILWSWVAEARIKGPVRMVDSNRTHLQRKTPISQATRCLATARFIRSQGAECLLLERQYITPVITVKPASITIKRQMRAERITDSPTKYKRRKDDQVRDHRESARVT